ncbi:PilT/PilU family type 4a pilus ATPase [candidate division KSB1 bacterium]|nr:PilT/PilU family type 4a pilus ATPase [candidate division KSB1 bacterium]
MAQIDRLFDKLLQKEGSDLHLLEGEKPKIRVHGRLKAIEDEAKLDRKTIESYLKEICHDERWEYFKQTKDLDFAYDKDAHSRFRSNYYYHLHGMGAVFRIIPTQIKTLEELQLPPVLKKFAELKSGLVLITGPTGSGKSTTLAALIDYINSRETKYILTIEEPIEFVHKNKNSYFCQREVGEDTPSFAQALRDASRQDVDVILVGEMRDYVTISLALSAASMGALVFGTLHTNSASKAIDRVVDAFPADEQGKARTMLADALRGVCAQLLLKTADGAGRIAVNEILLATQGLSKTIREGNSANIRNIIQAGKSNGMQFMDDMIEDYLNKGLIEGLEAYMKAQDKKRFEQFAPKSLV